MPRSSLRFRHARKSNARKPEWMTSRCKEEYHRKHDGIGDLDHYASMFGNVGYDNLH